MSTPKLPTRERLEAIWKETTELDDVDPLAAAIIRELEEATADIQTREAETLEVHASMATLARDVLNFAAAVARDMKR